MDDIERVPQDLQVKPKCLVVLTGLDVETNSTHASVWKGFSHNRRVDRAAIKFRCFPPDHDYPKAKPKASQIDFPFEWTLLIIVWHYPKQNTRPIGIDLIYR